MQSTPFRLGFIAALFATACGIVPAAADLPGLKEKQWLGRFLVSENRGFTFNLSTLAQGNIIPAGKSDKEISTQLYLPVVFLIEEVLPSGAVVTKKILPESFETKDPATLKPGKVTFRGKVTGDASFEAHIEVDHGIISIGGRLLEPGTLTKNPLRFGVRVTVPDVYRKAKKTEKDDAKVFAKKIKDDRYTLLWTDGKRVKFGEADSIDADLKNVNGPGIAELKVEMAAYPNKTLAFNASENSKIALSVPAAQPFYEGFAINWYPDPAKDPDAKALLKFTVK